MLGNRNATHSFAQIPDVKMTRSQFDRSHTIKLTMFFDYLTPIFVDEILPGDTMNLNLTTFCRLATQLVPVMDNMYMDYFFFFVPNRLVWDNWEKFNGAQTNPGDSTSYVIPSLAAFGANAPSVGSIFDYMGLPTNVAGAWTCQNALPFRCVNLIFNEWFRDQNLQNSVPVPTDDGPDPLGDYVMLYRGKRHDYFTSCHPWPQKGTAVQLPLGSSAPVITNTVVPNFTGTAGGFTNAALLVGTGAGAMTVQGGNAGAAQQAQFGTQTGLIADLTNATAATINAWRQAVQIQSLLELDARGGTRYVEILQAHFNVTSPDFRLQRPEYLGGGSQRFNSHPVAQTAPTSGSNYQGNLAAFGTGSGTNIGFTHSFVEHGYVIGMCAARADLTYQQGLDRMWSRQTRFDFFWPKLQQLGEQAVLNQELYAAGSGGSDTSVFGYQERYAEYRFKNSSIRGQFRSAYSAPLDYWHLAQDFSSLPSLNASFIESSTPMARIKASSTAVDILFDGWFKLKHARPMLTYSVPVSLGRF